MTENNTTSLDDTKRIFYKKGPCSSAFYYILNREFGQNREQHERAAEPFAGGLLMEGVQCGMIWGSTLAAGQEAFRRFENSDEATAMAVEAAGELIESLSRRTGTVDCGELTDSDWSKKWSIAKYLLSGKVISCFKLADRWAGEAVDTARKAMLADIPDCSQRCMSCSTELARKMRATDEEAVMVAGFAGGVGLSGNGCGALGAALFLGSLYLLKSNPGISLYQRPESQELLTTFYETTRGEILCHKITRQQFENLQHHTRYLQQGGCSALLEKLATKSAELGLCPGQKQ